MARIVFLALPLIFAPHANAQIVKDTVKLYTNHVHTTYAENLHRAELLNLALKNFTTNPSVMTHSVAKEAWKFARESYGLTEAFRFYNGPIDQDGGPEGRLNGWPLDEGYIDYVSGNLNAGIINNIAQYPVIDSALLESLNELDGEKNISTGYHAIEFLLWGQDFFEAGPGQRSYTDYLDAPNAERRKTYLNVLADTLVNDVKTLEVAWQPDQTNYRSDFELLKDEEALKKILTGAIFLGGDELSGERMYVAYDTQGQEDEQSCFSDMTHMDIRWNFEGMKKVILETQVLELPMVKGTKISQAVKDRLISLENLLATIPTPFDQAINNEAGRAIILSSIDELELLSKDMVEVSILLNAKVDY